MSVLYTAHSFTTRSVFTIVAMLVATAIPAIAQFGTTPGSGGVSITGAASIQEDQYSIAGNNFSTFRRQPPNQLRIMLSPMLTAAEWSMPVTISFSTWQSNSLTTIAPSQSVAQFFENPMNTMLFAPKYHWAQAFIGTYTPHYSDLSVGNASLFGLGVELRPSAMHFSAFAGTQQRGVTADFANNVSGAYARRLYGVKVGMDFNPTNTLDLNIVHMGDDVTSVAAASALPQSGTLVSLNAIHNDHDLMMRAELSGGSFSSNTLPSAPDSATKVRFAAQASAQYNQRTWDVSARIRYLGDGFIPLGYLFQPTDLLEFTISPSGRLFDNRVVVNATIGLRTDNLSGTKASTRHTMVNSFDGFARIDNEWTVNMAMTNFGMNLVAPDSVPAIRTTSGSISVGPRWTHAGADGTHSASATIMFDSYSDQSINTGAVTANDTRTLSGQYGFAFASMPLSLRATLSQFLNHLAGGPLTVTTFMVGASYPLMDRQLQPSVDLAYAGNATFGRATDSQILFRFSAVYNVTQKLKASIAGTLNLYTYGAATGVPSPLTYSFTEEYVRTSIAFQF